MDTDMGYIFLETHPLYPGQLHCVPKESLPSTKTSKFGAKVRYIAKYGNLFRGNQQLQSMLCKDRVNIDEGLYRVDLIKAIAMLETAPYRASRVWIDPQLRPSRQAQLNKYIDEFKAHNLRVDTFWYRVGFGFVFLLLLRLIGLF